MFEKASSSQAPSANKRLFGSSLSIDCHSVFPLSTSFSRDLGNGLSFSQKSMPSTSSSCCALFTIIPPPPPLDPPLYLRESHNQFIETHIIVAKSLNVRHNSTLIKMSSPAIRLLSCYVICLESKIYPGSRVRS